MCNCNKAILNAASTTAQTIAAGSAVPLLNNNVLVGSKIAHVVGSANIGLAAGYYEVMVNADIEPTAAGDISLQLQNIASGQAVNVPGAEATVTGAAGDTYNVSFSTIIAVPCSCRCINNNANLQIVLSAAGTVNNINVSAKSI